MKNKILSKSGSALITAMLFMVALVTLSFAVNYMLLLDIRAESNYLNGMKAYYLAEAGIENGLLDVSLGVEIDESNTSSSNDGENLVLHNDVISGGGAIDTNSYTYSVIVGESNVPCSFEENKNGWGVLKWGESISLPLDANTFQVDYYLVNSKDETIDSDLSLADVLRWKIIGNRNDNNQVDAISDFIPLWGIDKNSSGSHSSFGTINNALFNVGKYYDSIEGAVSAIDGDIEISDNYAESEFYHLYHATYPISDFLKNHSNNILHLANFYNVIPGDNVDAELSFQGSDYDLYYRINDGLLPDNENAHNMNCTSVKASADAVVSSKFKQSLDIIRPLTQPLPVADFVWYQN